MEFLGGIKRIRQSCFLTKQDFAKEVQVAFSIMNTCVGVKVKSNLTAMKNIKEFCFRNNVDYSGVEEAWLDFKVEK